LENDGVRGTRSQSLELLWIKGGENRLELLIYQQYWTGEGWAELDRFGSSDYKESVAHHTSSLSRGFFPNTQNHCIAHPDRNPFHGKQHRLGGGD